MLFILQKLKEDHNMFIDQIILKDLLRNSEHDYEELYLTDLKDPESGFLWAECFPEKYKKAIPLGTIEFLTLPRMNQYRMFYNKCLIID